MTIFWLFIIFITVTLNAINLLYTTTILFLSTHIIYQCFGLYISFSFLFWCISFGFFYYCMIFNTWIISSFKVISPSFSILNLLWSIIELDTLIKILFWFLFILVYRYHIIWTGKGSILFFNIKDLSVFMCLLVN